MKGVGGDHHARFWELRGALGLCVWLLDSFPLLPSAGASWLTGTELVSQDRCLSSGLHVVTVGNYDLFQKEFAINLS